MFWDGLRIKVTRFPGGGRVHSAQLVVAVPGKNKTTVFILNQLSIFGHSNYTGEL